MLMLLTHITNIAKLFELTQGQGHKVKGEGQICTDIKKREKLIKKLTDKQILMILTHIAYIGQMFKLT